MENPPLIQALKTYGSLFNVSDFLTLPDNTPYGNLNLTYSQIVIRLECLNELIKNLYEDFNRHREQVKARGGWSHLHEGFKHKFYIEQVLYWLRKTADEFISIIYILDQYKQTGNYPNEIKISSIGKLLNSKEDITKLFVKHRKLLVLLNDISNAHKHTLINAQVHNHVGKDEPVVFALSAFNKSTTTPTFHSVGLRAMLEAYDNFLIDIKEILMTEYQLKQETINN